MIPALHIEDGLFFDESKNAYAAFVINAPDYGFQSESEKLRQIYTVIKGLREVVGQWHLYSIALGISPSRWRDKLPPFNDPIWHEHCDEVECVLEESKPFERQIYLMIPMAKVNKMELNLTNALEFGKKAWQEIWAGMKQALKNYVSVEEMTLDRLSALHREKMKWKDRFGSFTQLRAASVSEIEAWIRHSMYRGLVEPEPRMPQNLPKFVSSNGVVHPVRPAGVWLQDAFIDEHPFYLEAKHPDGKVSYQTFFAALRVPSEIDEDYLLGNEWIYEVENLPYPVDLALHVRVEDHREAQKKLRDKIKQADNKRKEYEDNDEELPIELQEEIDSTTDLGRRLRAREPLVHVKMIVGIGTDNREDLFSLSKQLLSDLEHVQLVQAPGDQQKFWQAFFPFGQELPVAYETPMDPGILACGVPFAKTNFGDESGFLLGETFSGRAVFMDPRRPAQELNRPPGILISGTSGGGKTYLAQNLLTMMMSWGAKCFVNDPKGNDYDSLAELPYRIRYIRMVPGSEPFNPFRLGLDGSVRDLLDIIFNDAHETTIRNYREIVIGDAVDMVMSGTKKDMHAFEDALRTLEKRDKRPQVLEQIDIILSLLQTLKRDPLGALLFAHDRGEQPSDFDCTVVCTNGLTLPERTTGESRWSSRERLSVALFYAVATMGLGYFSSLPKHILKVLALDESWVLKTFSQGRDLINKALRLARSLNIIPVMMMQFGSDFEEFGESITGLFSWRFLFRQRSSEEVKASLRIAGLNESDSREWEEPFFDFSSGEGLVVDAMGNINLIRTAPYPARLHELFKNTPESMSA